MLAGALEVMQVIIFSILIIGCDKCAAQNLEDFIIEQNDVKYDEMARQIALFDLYVCCFHGEPSSALSLCFVLHFSVE